MRAGEQELGFKGKLGLGLHMLPERLVGFECQLNVNGMPFFLLNHTVHPREMLLHL